MVSLWILSLPLGDAPMTPNEAAIPDRLAQVKAALDPGQHLWARMDGLIACLICGNVRRADRRNKPCSGVTPEICMRVSGNLDLDDPKVQEALEDVGKAALRALDATPSASGEGWQTIETAPKDGTRILIAIKLKEGWVIDAAVWDTYGYDGAWASEKGNLATGQTFITPDFWTPLPPPPVQPGPQRRACSVHTNPGHGAAIGCPACFEYVYPPSSTQKGGA